MCYSFCFLSRENEKERQMVGARRFRPAPATKAEANKRRAGGSKSLVGSAPILMSKKKKDWQAQKPARWLQKDNISMIFVELDIYFFYYTAIIKI